MTMVTHGYTLYQPYSNLITMKFKTGETRFYIRSFRGDLLICSAKKIIPQPELQKLMTQTQYGRFLEIQRKCTHDIFSPLGAAQCVVKVVDWRPMNKLEDLEITFIDYHPDRCVAILEDIRPIASFNIRGRQGLFKLTKDEQDKIEFGI
jgi:hypothetical protein